MDLTVYYRSNLIISSNLRDSVCWCVEYVNLCDSQLDRDSKPPYNGSVPTGWVPTPSRKINTP